MKKKSILYISCGLIHLLVDESMKMNLNLSQIFKLSGKYLPALIKNIDIPKI